jgi:uncharacterized membrane protein YGL010W
MILAALVGVLFVGPLFVVAERLTEKLGGRRKPAISKNPIQQIERPE